MFHGLMALMERIVTRQAIALLCRAAYQTVAKLAAEWVAKEYIESLLIVIAFVVVLLDPLHFCSSRI